MRLFFFLIFFLFFMVPVENSFSYNSTVATTYNRLDEIKLQKKNRILELFGSVEEKAKSVKNDKSIKDFFYFIKESSGKNHISSEENLIIDEYEGAIREYYLMNYLEFYDMIFIDNCGEIFYTIRKEPNYKKNIFESSELKNSLLSEKIKNSKKCQFVDYQFFPSTGETSAFFVVPVAGNDKISGWIILQYSINKLNTLLVDYQELGNTGEVYIVNQDHLILTNSRFTPEETSLRLRIDTEAVDDAFTFGSGHKLISGYRGVNVFTSFEKFTFWGVQWALVASIEEAEILTDYYLKNENSLNDAMFDRLSRRVQSSHASRLPLGLMSKVDIDEAKKGQPGTFLQTWGVSTCTAISVMHPEHFAYLSHISPFDKIYGTANLTNQLKDLIEKIKYNDIYLRELNKLKIVIVATHTNSIKNAIQKLTRYGIKLSQISFAYDPNAKYANIICSGSGDEMLVEWIYDNGKFVEDVEKIEDLAQIVKSLAL